jgi:hypothetical protein
VRQGAQSIFWPGRHCFRVTSSAFVRRPYFIFRTEKDSAMGREISGRAPAADLQLRLLFLLLHIFIFCHFVILYTFFFYFPPNRTPVAASLCLFQHLSLLPSSLPLFLPTQDKQTSHQAHAYTYTRKQKGATYRTEYPVAI